jgi:hypothetical protein
MEAGYVQGAGGAGPVPHEPPYGCFLTYYYEILLRVVRDELGRMMAVN